MELPPGVEPRPADSASDLFASQSRSFGLPYFERELRFARELGRQWRFDFGFVDYKVAVEIEGLAVRRLEGQLVVMGRHASPAGICEDMDKYNHAALLGWTVLRFPQKDVKPRNALRMTMRVLTSRGWGCDP